MEKPLIIAHRGASSCAPENTFSAFQRAVEDKADGIEFDVRLAKDAVPVVFHDADLKRIARRKIAVSSLSSKELQTFDVGSWFNLKNPKKANIKFAAERIPTFAELLDFLKNYRGLLYVELKGSEREIFALTESVCHLIAQNALFSQIIIKSFNLECLLFAKKILPEIRTAALFEPVVATVLQKRNYILAKAEQFRADEISLHYSLVTGKLIEAATAANLSVVIWTVDRTSWVNRAVNLKITAIISNDPARMIAKRREILQNI